MKIKIKTITPVFVGSGDKISPVSECVIENENLHIIDKERLINLLKGQNLKDSILELTSLIITGGSIKDFLKEKKININEIKKYSLKLKRESKGDIKRVVNLPILSGERAYIPGSTIKGLLRSALLFYYIEFEKNGKLEYKKETYIGEDILRKDPKKVETDIMKYVIVRDSTTIPFEDLEVYEVLKIPHKKLSQFCICIPTGKIFQTEIIVKDLDRENLVTYWEEFLKDENNILEALRNYSLKLIKKEIFLLEKLKKPNIPTEVFDHFIDHYNEILKRLEDPQKKNIFIPIGFGKTYYFNSLGYFLKNKNTKIFPTTRWAVKIGEKYYPLGWCGVVKVE